MLRQEPIKNLSTKDFKLTPKYHKTKNLVNTVLIKAFLH